MCGLLARSGVEILELTGADRHRFLNGQVTCEIKGLEAGSGTYGFFTDIKGRVQSDVTVLALDDRLWLELPRGRVAAIAEHLEKYLLADQVAVVSGVDAVGLMVAGPGAAALLEGLDWPVPTEPWGHQTFTMEGTPVRVVAQGNLGVEGYTLWVPQAGKEAVTTALGQAGLKALDPAALDAWRIVAGIARFGEDFGPENFPQETGLTDAVSYTKGCYLGQEVVARLHYRGQVSRQLRRLRGEGGAVMEKGAELLFEGRPVGTISSVAGPPFLDPALALAIVQRRAFEPETQLALAATGGTVVVLPLSESKSSTDS